LLEEVRRRNARHWASFDRSIDQLNQEARMKRLVIAIAAALATVGVSGLLSATVFTPSADAATCHDGSYSYSYGSGTCSWHGGVDRSYSYRPTPYSYMPYKYRPHVYSYTPYSYKPYSYKPYSYGYGY
jgi:Protein of unknown function (DUF3761)